MEGSGTFNTLPKSDFSFSTSKSFEFKIPTSRSFSLSGSGFWGASKGPFQKWIKSIPDPVPRDESLEPARYHTLKHGLSRDDSDDDSAEQRGHKRAKHGPTAGNRQTSDSRRGKFSNTGGSLVRRVSNACQRVVAPARHRSVSQKPGSFSRNVTPIPEPTPSPGTPSFALIDRPKMRFVFVGDAECGKSSALLRFYRDTFTLDYRPTQYELFHKVVAVDGQDIDVEIWDTAGDVALEQLARLTYLAWDCVFLCFSVSSPRSFNSARSQWISQIRRYTRGAPLILVGTKTDLRVGPSLWSPLYPDLDTRITATEGAMTATVIGATKYVECSALTGQGIEGIFEEGVRVVNQTRNALKKLETPNVNRFHGLSEMLCFK
ncbi:P-loop containing nucleoside triphosphate hydrolase protein [Xylaria intraflava]|nr:P-loop containing nucleoside triphosphate hydrolase protein [Xylaria intraflava]